MPAESRKRKSKEDSEEPVLKKRSKANDDIKPVEKPEKREDEDRNPYWEVNNDFFSQYPTTVAITYTRCNTALQQTPHDNPRL
jgi:hypothetical protein